MALMHNACAHHTDTRL